ncbi:hypothetical protein AGDE_16552 [Angomonas deanei]|nr:hypothetical protein AGDE_16552 [Angomonas deanei]|eukprot:EPY16901.1 hypothetical protein AGDE_16552 [Angomonas deanei]
MMLAEIEEREMRRLEAKERAETQEETRQIANVELTLEKERKAVERTHRKYSEMEKKQADLFKKTNQRQIDAEARRQSMERERQEKLRKAIEEKEQRAKERDPYASFLIRRRSSALAVEGVNSAPQRHADPVETSQQEEEIAEIENGEAQEEVNEL